MNIKGGLLHYITSFAKEGCLKDIQINYICKLFVKNVYYCSVNIIKGSEFKSWKNHNGPF
jgi:hypothetical protein